MGKRERDKGGKQVGRSRAGSRRGGNGRAGNSGKGECGTRSGGEQRAVALLAGAEAFGRVDGEIVRIFAPKRGITLQIGIAPLAVLRALESSGAVEPAGAGGRYVLSQAGQARARRQASADPAVFAAQHRDIAKAPAFNRDEPDLAVNLAESPLLWLHRRGNDLVGDAEFAAGERLRADMTMARTMPRVTANLEREARSGVTMALQPGEARIAAAQRVDAALRAVGPEFSGILVDVCGFLLGLEQVERDRGWPARSAKLVLSLALATLARHYGLSNCAIGSKSGRKAHVWRDQAWRAEFTLPDPASAPPAPRP